MSANWRPTRLEVHIGLSKCVVEATPNGWRWSVVTGTRVDGDRVATQREAMLSAEQAALGLNVERRQERAGLAPRR